MNRFKEVDDLINKILDHPLYARDESREPYIRLFDREKTKALIQSALSVYSCRSDSFAGVYAADGLMRGVLELKDWAFTDDEAEALMEHRRKRDQTARMALNGLKVVRVEKPNKPQNVIRHKHFWSCEDHHIRQVSRIDACELKDGNCVVWDVDKDEVTQIPGDFELACLQAREKVACHGPEQIIEV